MARPFVFDEDHHWSSIHYNVLYCPINYNYFPVERKQIATTDAKAFWRLVSVTWVTMTNKAWRKFSNIWFYTPISTPFFTYQFVSSFKVLPLLDTMVGLMDTHHPTLQTYCWRCSPWNPFVRLVWSICFDQTLAWRRASSSLSPRQSTDTSRNNIKCSTKFNKY